MLDSIEVNQRMKRLLLYTNAEKFEILFFIKCTALGPSPLPRIFKTVGASFHSTAERYVVGSI